MANDFFKNGDKAYSENLNDGILVGNAFDWTVDISLPTDTGSVFPNSSTVVKAKVADVSIAPNSNLSIGSTISNSSGSSQVYRLTVYPDFNRFGGFKSISLTADSGVTFYIANKGGTSPIASNLDYDDLGNVPELKVLKEYDIVISIANGKSVSGLEFVFQSKSADVSGSISQSNVNGLDDRLDNIEGTVNDLFDLVYPVGSIYMSVNSTSPSILFGGTWEQLKDKFLLASGDTYTAGNTGGSATVSLTEAQMPRHTHTQNAHSHMLSPENNTWTANNDDSTRSRFQTSSSGNKYVIAQESENGWIWAGTSPTTATNKYTGGTGTTQSASNGSAHENMPPYIVVNIWKRTA